LPASAAPSASVFPRARVDHAPARRGRDQIGDQLAPLVHHLEQPVAKRGQPERVDARLERQPDRRQRRRPRGDVLLGELRDQRVAPDPRGVHAHRHRRALVHRLGQRGRLRRPVVIDPRLQQPGRVRQPGRLAIQAGPPGQARVLRDRARKIDGLAQQALHVGGQRLDRHAAARFVHQQLELVARQRRQRAVAPARPPRQLVDDRVQPSIHADEPVHRLGDVPAPAAGQLAVRPEGARDDVGREPPLRARLGRDLERDGPRSCIQPEGAHVVISMLFWTR